MLNARAGRPALLLFALVLLAWAQQKLSIVDYVKAALAANNVPLAQKALEQYRSVAGTSPEYIEALSWLGRAALARNDFAGAEANASQVRQLSLAALAKR